MKQYITKIQWDELSIEQQAKFYYGISDRDAAKIIEAYNSGVYMKASDWKLATIGQLIEFLGTDLNVMEFIGKWSIVVCDDQGYLKEELIDALWMATKHKLKL